MAEFASTGVLETCRQVAATARSVEIAADAVSALALRLAEQRAPVSDWHSPWHFFDGTARSATAILALDAVNFCFWGDDEASRWRVRIGEVWLQGYWACAACCKRAIESGMPLYDAPYLAQMSLADADQLFAGDARSLTRIPLLPERLACLRQLGRVLVARYGGRADRLIAAARGSAVTLVQLLVGQVSSFDDVAVAFVPSVRFYKRAQIAAADLHAAFQGERYGAFSDIEALTAFADYKVPQVLRRYGVLKYAPLLAHAIDRYRWIPPGHPWEVEIRAATVCAVDDLHRVLASQGIVQTAAQLDSRLWLLGQEPHPDDRPYHRTRTIFY